MWFRWKVRGSADKGTADEIGRHTWWKLSDTSVILEENSTGGRELIYSSKPTVSPFSPSPGQAKQNRKCLNIFTSPNNKWKIITSGFLQRKSYCTTIGISFSEKIFTELRIEWTKNPQCCHSFFLYFLFVSIYLQVAFKVCLFLPPLIMYVCLRHANEASRNFSLVPTEVVIVNLWIVESRCFNQFTC